MQISNTCTPLIETNVLPVSQTATPTKIKLKISVKDVADNITRKKSSNATLHYKMQKSKSVKTTMYHVQNTSGYAVY